MVDKQQRIYILCDECYWASCSSSSSCSSNSMNVILGVAKIYIYKKGIIPFH